MTKRQSTVMRTIRISTHTLTWSVTLLRTKLSCQKYISTHTLTWSVTDKQYKTETGVTTISTHTLTWSVTRDLILM